MEQEARKEWLDEWTARRLEAAAERRVAAATALEIAANPQADVKTRAKMMEAYLRLINSRKIKKLHREATNMKRRQHNRKKKKLNELVAGHDT